jgi:Protein of unknown function (DUF2442)
MRTLTDIKPLKDFRLECVFNEGTKKIADLKPFLNTEAFKALANPDAFSAIKNCKYFVEWSVYEVDLSADTLWHIAAPA